MITLGDPAGVHWPAVLETDTLTEGEAVVEALARAPGVMRVDVVSIDFSDQVLASGAQLAEVR